MSDSEKTIFGIHSNAVTEGQQDELPHSWISIDKNGEITTYGSWPTKNDDVIAYGQEGGWNGQGTDVQKNIELASELQAAHSHYTELTPQQQEVLDQKLDEPHEWTRHDNCASWTARIASDVTGERVSATDTVKSLHEDGGIAEIEVDNSKGVSKSIQELEREKESNQQQVSSQQHVSNEIKVDVQEENAKREALQAEAKESKADDKPPVKAVDGASTERVDVAPSITFSNQMDMEEITLKKQHSDPFAPSSSDQEKEETESEVSDHSSVEVDERMEAALNRQAYVRSLSEQQAEKENEGR